ncbi:MAG: UDP-N-acetylmuramoyl-L-alanine--D-glutamate ligase [Candidatus Omnitrophica bacterium]|nr:UDP-N-acetylmuramoyl-L-alanine--D-glutamate ligase [Candidatus Omnitrophota bacterium]
MMNLQGKKVTVVGIGKSGVAACNLLLKKRARVSITDCLDNQRIRENILRLKDKKNIVNIEIGNHSEDLVKGQDLVVTSPGVSLNAPPILWARKKGIPVIGEIELAFAFCSAPIIAITGTNGKTTVSALVGEIFRAVTRKYIVCGNIGTPFSAEVERITNEHIVVLEVSSFQLETVDRFKPKVAAILNLTVDHLDRHANFNEYLIAKSRIFSNQNEEDWTLLNEEDPHALALAAKTRAKVLYFSKTKNVDPALKQFNNNHFAALAISSIFAVPKEAAINTCRYFQGIEHRLEKVRQIREVEFINDSKATNVDSTLWALDSIKRPVILIAGGRDKGSDFAVGREKMKNRVRAMVLLGEAKEKIEDAFGEVVLTKKAETLAEAVRDAFALSRPGDCILFSPMCASFDMFKDYAERGRVFKKAVDNLT